MSKEKSNSQIVLGLVGVFTLVVVVGVIVYFFRGITQDIEWLSIDNVDVSENTILIKAFNPNSGQMITGYDYTTEDKTVSIKLRGTLVNELGNSISEDNIVMNGNFSSIEKIVLLGKSNKSKIIWNK
ncbi:hypothetical protein ACFVR1_03160 [Psychrobacillus sp. NPDC058041]|uniref:hypothetical protein n=1 Tax=Psychrobacillus sp. NPDC058041 TaxID=3346310 RepID=UPI0036DDBD86